MDQNQTNQPVDQSVDNDLQKAIDNITNTTNIDPVFSDPVAAPSSVPEGDNGELGEPVGPFPEPKVATVTQGPEPMAPLESMDVPELNDLSVPEPEIAPEAAPGPAPVIEAKMPDIVPSNLNTSEVKKAALRDLVPLLDKVSMNSSEKFKIYRDIFDDLKDYTVLDPAYHAAREIPDETERAKALLYLIKSIDQM